jgi:hypothetical protein
MSINPYGTPQEQTAWLLSQIDRVAPRIAELDIRYPTDKPITLDYLATVELGELNRLKLKRHYWQDQLKEMRNGQ